MGNRGPGHGTGPFLSPLPPLVTITHFGGPSSTTTTATAVPSSSQGTGLTLLPLPTLFHLLFLLFQVSQPPFLPSTHILQPLSPSSHHPPPSRHCHPHRNKKRQNNHHLLSSYSVASTLQRARHLLNLFTSMLTPEPEGSYSLSQQSAIPFIRKNSLLFSQ